MNRKELIDKMIRYLQHFIDTECVTIENYSVKDELFYRTSESDVKRFAITIDYREWEGKSK